MKIVNCLHPHRVYNKYTKEYVYAPCGSCSLCLQRKTLNWTQRLTQERYSWKYCVFATLTYSPENVPTLHADKNNMFLYDLSHKHFHPEFGDVLIDMQEVYDKLEDTDKISCKNWLLRQSGQVKYLSVGDAQRFIKRLRINLKRFIDKRIKDDKEHGIKTPEQYKDFGIRYFLAGEYGETTLRPHYHCLFFFSNEWTASAIEKLILSSWKFGTCDISFVKDSNASYVAGYVNCSYNLPPVLLHKRIRPFSLFSKHPFIGSMCHSSQEVKQIFFSATPDHTIFNHQKSAFENVPLWRSYINLLYPKISRFSDFSHTDRVNLYRAYERYVQYAQEPNYPQFKEWLVYGYKNWYHPSLYTVYVRYLFDIPNTSVLYKEEYEINDSVLYRFYCITSRVYHQARSFEIPIREYVSIIERFYDNCEKRKLKIQYDYEENLTESNHLDSVFTLDREFARTIVNLELCDLTSNEIDVLSSFGIDVEKFFSDDMEVRNIYRYSFLPESCFEYRSLAMDSEQWIKDHTKSKKKNDYIFNHPELQNVLWGDDPINENV